VGERVNDTLTTTPPARTEDDIRRLDAELSRCGAKEAAQLLTEETDDVAARALSQLHPDVALRILDELSPQHQTRIVAMAPSHVAKQWERNRTYPEGAIGRLMDPALAVFSPDQTVAETIQELRTIVRIAFITYGWVTDADGRLLGVLVFRELLFADPDQPLSEVMLAKPFSLRPELQLLDAMREVLTRHYPVYPVCDDSGRLLGVVRGQTLFEHQAFEISAQAGSMVGVEKEERLSTPWSRSFLMRHPWLQFNLLTAFVAAATVGAFEETIAQIVALAVFLPVLAGQSGNTGCQALAVTLRGMTLGDLRRGDAWPLVLKEAGLGLLNGLGTGVTAGIGMLIFTWMKGHPNGPILALIVFLAMTGSCLASGISGAVVPLALKRLGADPATASSIFLTTATDVASMGMFLGLATLLIL
jgi:magnesium transporter